MATRKKRILSVPYSILLPLLLLLGCPRGLAVRWGDGAAGDAGSGAAPSLGDGLAPSDTPPSGPRLVVPRAGARGVPLNARRIVASAPEALTDLQLLGPGGEEVRSAPIEGRELSCGDHFCGGLSLEEELAP